MSNRRRLIRHVSLSPDSTNFPGTLEQKKVFPQETPVPVVLFPQINRITNGRINNAGTRTAEVAGILPAVVTLSISYDNSEA